MKVFIHTPYSCERNLGTAYNEFMQLLPEDSAACFLDGDCCFLTPDFGTILHDYANAYPNNVLTCWTNRTHKVSIGQQLPNGTDSIKDLLQLAYLLSKTQQTATPLTGPVSGFLLVVPKSVWLKHKFTETNVLRPGTPNLLGVDNSFTNEVRAAGIEVLRMDSMLVWHTYRLLDGSKQHLL